MSTESFTNAQKVSSVKTVVEKFETPVFDVVKAAAATGQFKTDEIINLYTKLLKATICNHLDLPHEQEFLNRIS